MFVCDCVCEGSEKVLFQHNQIGELNVKRKKKHEKLSKRFIDIDRQHAAVHDKRTQTQRHAQSQSERAREFRFHEFYFRQQN